ncbi:MAG: hypothetical protein DHS20C18_43530 [Saprospiraceae bacterium]|nr:MAG: hypothetical protein DHS20C18_43530 [Saprospiraceae bacterium]
MDAESRQPTSEPTNPNTSLYLQPKLVNKLSDSNQVKALEVIFHRFQPVLVGYARQLVHSAEDAREVVQDVFLAVWNNRENLKLDESLKAYLFTATRNKCYNHLRKRRLDTVEMNESVPEAYQDQEVEGKLHTDELKALIYDEINTLPERCRNIFLLSREEDLTNKAIAEKLNISVKTVENQMTIALKRLRIRVYGSDQKASGSGKVALFMIFLTFFKILWG